MKSRKVKMLALALSVSLIVGTVIPASASTETSVQAVTEQQAGTAEVIETPEVTDMPEVTGIPEITETPEVTETPEETGIPEVTDAPEATEAPEGTETPEPTKVPEETDALAVEETDEENVSADAIAAQVSVKASEVTWVHYNNDTEFALRNIATGELYKSTLVKITDGSTVRYYGFNSSGNMRTGLVSAKNSTGSTAYYYFVEASKATITTSATTPQPDNSDIGTMVIGDWANAVSGAWYYLGSDGVRDASKVGKQKVSNGNYYYLNSDGTPIKSQWKQITESGTSYWFFFDKNGVMKRNTIFKAPDGYTYGVASNGRMYTGKRKINGKWYYFNKTAVGKKPQGSAVKGWQYLKVSGKYYWHYFSTSNYAAVTGPKLWTKGKKTYYVDKYGRMNRGGTLVKYSGSYYYFKAQSSSTKPYMVKGTWLKKNGKRYYAKSNGKLASGWLKIGKSRYYFRKTTASNPCSMVTNAVKSRNGKKYYIGNDGKAVTNGWLKMNGNWRYIDSEDGFVKGWKVLATGSQNTQYKFYFNKKGYLVQDLRSILGSRSASQYRLEVDKSQCVVTVMTKGSDGVWNIPVVSFVCSVGNPISLTPNGTFTATRAGRWQMLMGPSWGQYGTHVVNGIYFHSVACPTASVSAVPVAGFNALGAPASHGCIRLCVRDAKWIYENCNGSTVYIHAGAKSLAYDKPTLPKMSGTYCTDPTDPAA